MYAPTLDKSDGFSLLEILVAISIFSVISVAVFSTMDQYFSTTEVLNRRNDQFTAMNRFLQMIERDIQYAINRKVRSRYGEDQAGLVVGPIDENEFLSFTSSLPNYDYTGHSQLFRVSWSFHDSTVTRSYWEVLDRAQDSEPVRHNILQGVRDLQSVVKPDRVTLDESGMPIDTYLVELTITPKMGPDINRRIRFFGEF